MSVCRSREQEPSVLDACEQRSRRRVLPICAEAMCWQPPLWDGVSSGRCAASCAGSKALSCARRRATNAPPDASAAEGAPARLKVLLLVSLVDSFVLTLLDERLSKLKAWRLRDFCHR